MNKKIYVIDGKSFSNLEEFSREFSEKLLQNYRWYGNFDALNDILSGGFGTPDEGFVLVWKNSKISREKLGLDETIKHYTKIYKNTHPAYLQAIIKELKEGEGKTLFDKIVEIINLEEHKDIELNLE